MSHYIDLHKRHYGGMPDDIHQYVRREADIPFTMKDEIMEALVEVDWVEDKIASPDPTMIERLVRRHL